MTVKVVDIISKWILEGQDLLNKYGLHAVYLQCILRNIYHLDTVRCVFGKKNKTQDFVWLQYGNNLIIDTEEYYKAIKKGSFVVDSSATYDVISRNNSDVVVGEEFRKTLSTLIRTNKKL